MNPNYPTPGPSSLPYYPELSHGYDDEEDSAYLSQAESLSGSYQSNDSAESLNTSGSSFHQSHQPNLYVSEYLSIPQFVPNTSTHQWSYPLAPSPLKDFPLTDDHVPGPSFDNLSNDVDALHAAPAQEPHYPTHSGSSNLHMGQGVTVGYWPQLSLQDGQGALGPSDPPEPTVDILSSELYPQFAVQDDYPYATLSHRGQMEGAAQSLVATQGQYATTGEASSRHEQKAAKKERDKERKRIDRSNSARDYERICELLNISLSPRNTLSNRILVGVETVVERLKLDNDLQHRLEKSEANVRSLKMKMAKHSTRANAAAPINAHITG